MENIRWKLIGNLGRIILWIWTKTNRMTVVGEKALLKLRDEKKPVVLLVWHGRIFIVPFFFRKRDIMPLVSPSENGEIAARIMDGWGYRILRGSSSHSIVKEWKEMVNELNRGGEVIIVPDGPKGPDRKMKLGGLKLAQKTGAYLVPFTFSTNKKKILKSWDSFLMFYPFRKIVAMYGDPISIDSGLSDKKLENERQRVEDILIELDHKADKFFD